MENGLQKILNKLFDIRLDQNIGTENCNFIKVILMFLVVLYHSIALWLPDGWFIVLPYHECRIFTIIAQYLNTFHVHAFFLVSGYLYAYLRFEQGRYPNFLSLFKNKFSRLMVPYFSISIFWTIPWKRIYYKIGFKELLRNFLFGLSPSQLWFVLALFHIFIIAYLIGGMPQKHPVWCIGFAILLFVVSIFGRKLFPDCYQILNGFKYFIFFIIGTLIRIFNIKDINRFLKIFLMLFNLSLFIIYIKLQVYNIIWIKVINYFIMLCLNISGALLSFFLLGEIAEKINYHDSCIYIFFSKYFFTIYLFHQQIIYGVIILLNEKVSAGMLFLANLGISIGISSLISIILDRWKITRFLIGKNEYF